MGGELVALLKSSSEGKKETKPLMTMRRPRREYLKVISGLLLLAQRDVMAL